MSPDPKVLYGEVNNDGLYNNAQRIDCPLGAAQLGGPDDCTADNRVVYASAGLKFGTGGANTVTGAPIQGFPYYIDGLPYNNTYQYITGLEINYALSDVLSLTPSTGFYKTGIDTLNNVNGTDSLFPFKPAAGPAGAGGIAAQYVKLNIREVLQEIRLSSGFDGSINFLVGGYFQDSKLLNDTAIAVNAINPIQLFPPLRITQNGTAYSLFGSLSYKPIDTVEFSGGARYSNERKHVGFFRLYSGSIGAVPYNAGDEILTPVNSRTFHNVSPELTINWRPTQRLTMYGGWKRGFLSGGFNPTQTGTSVIVLPDSSYGQEVVEGFEGGVKAALFDGSLRLNLAAYSYKIKGLQVTSVTNLVLSINNASSARSKGFEADMNWQTPIASLSLRGAIAYDSARYGSFTNSPCYAGQTIAEGCVIAGGGGQPSRISAARS
jgi:iron complex outermembrane recepter protein